ncbi:MAG: hypothetical protein S4CHLAM81_09560 [Chlamydiales bacterium]|nr:hypothetical protein [Chlamydiales bacterium]MCH9635734.1 hypothetical protein [Chlamydiales bacterium]MCH9704288.1 hypothetical protein [Chlamydiota bacterium]
MADTGGVGGLGTPQGPKGPEHMGPAGDPAADFKMVKGQKELNLTADQSKQIKELRSDNGFSGPISPLEMWFMEHSGGDPIKGIMMYQRFIKSMMMTTLTSMTGMQRASMQRQKQADRQAYGGMA